MAPQYAQPEISEGMKILFYLLSFFIFLAGIIIGVVYYSKTDPESRHVGKMCIVFAVVGLIVEIAVGLTIWLAIWASTGV